MTGLFLNTILYIEVANYRFLNQSRRGQRLMTREKEQRDREKKEKARRKREEKGKDKKRGRILA